MTDSANHEVDLWPQFDAYMKKAIRSLNNGYGRLIQKRSPEVLFDNPSITSFIEQAQPKETENYPSDHHILEIQGVGYQLDDDALYQALTQLPERFQHILILKFWLGYNEKEIADALHLSRRACYSRRERALKLLRKKLIGGTNGQKKAP